MQNWKQILEAFPCYRHGIIIANPYHEIVYLFILHPIAREISLNTNYSSCRSISEAKFLLFDNLCFEIRQKHVDMLLFSNVARYNLPCFETWSKVWEDLQLGFKAIYDITSCWISFLLLSLYWSEFCNWSYVCITQGLLFHFSEGASS